VLRTPLNLAAAVNIVFYDRHVKSAHGQPGAAPEKLAFESAL